MKELYFTIPAMLAICYFQYRNWQKYKYQGNGANVQRLAMMMGSVGAMGTCIGCVFKSFEFIAWSVTIVPLSGAVLYWPIIATWLRGLLKKINL